MEGGPTSMLLPMSFTPEIGEMAKKMVKGFLKFLRRNTTLEHLRNQSKKAMELSIS